MTRLIENAPTIEPDGDLISRQGAIDALNKEYHGMLSDESMKIYQIKNWLSALPSAPESRRQHGKWVKATGMMPPEFHGHHCCSVCGGFAGMEVPYGNREDFSNFCPSCGANMEDYDITYMNEYERAVDQMEHDIAYEPTYNPEDGSM